MLRRTERFSVHGYDVDAFHTLAVPALAGYLEEVAAHHATDLGCGLDALAGRGLTWVLVRQRIELSTPIALGDELTITTWPSGIDRLLVSREFVVARAEGEEVARASTRWLLLDVATRRPIRPDDVLDAALRPVRERVAEIAARLAAPGAGAAERTFDVRFSDIDVNRHVNNTSYVAWALESVDPATWTGMRAASVEAHYLAEALLGDDILARTAPDAGDELAHAVLRGRDGKELARLRTRWVAR